MGRNQDDLILCFSDPNYMIYYKNCSSFVESFVFNPAVDSEVNALDFICGHSKEFLQTPLLPSNCFDVTMVLLTSWLFIVLPQLKVSLWSYISIYYEYKEKENAFEPDRDKKFLGL